MAAAPFFVSERTGPPAKGRLLLISYHFPPSRAAGALRWQKMAAHAWNHGWGLDVVTLAADDLPVADLSTLADLPSSTRLFGVPDAGPRFWERGENLLWGAVKRFRKRAPGGDPDNARVGEPVTQSLARGDLPRIPRTRGDWRRAYNAWSSYAREQAWQRLAASTALQVIDPTVHAAVVTCGPPHMVHEAGRMVAARAGLPHVMDLRDPWAGVERLYESFASPVWYFLARRHEERCVRSAALVAMNTEPARAVMATRYPDRADAMVAVLNGCDDVFPATAATREGPFRVMYAGNMYLDRDPRPLLRASSVVVRELGLDPIRFQLDFIGQVASYGGVAVASLAAAEGLADHVRVHAPMPRRELFALLAEAAVLVSLPQDSDSAIPSKVYEYTGFPAWLLAFATPESATGLLLHGSGADVVGPGDVVATAAVLRRRFLEHEAGVRATPIATQARFTRRYQAGIFFAALEHVLQPSEANRSRPAAIG